MAYIPKNYARLAVGYREKALKLFPWVCGRCSREFVYSNLRELTVHHIDHDHSNNPEDGSNWEMLCLYCHDHEHSKYTEADPQMCFIGEGMFGITAILDPERMNFTYDDFEYVENLYSSIFVASARKELGITSIDALKAYLEEGNQIMVGTNGATGSEAFLAAALIGAMGYGDQFYLIPYESAAEAAQAVARGEVDIAVSHQSQILETWQQGGVDVFAAFDGEPIAQGPFKGVEGVGQYGYPYFRNRCFIFAKAGADEQKIADLKALYAQILTDEEMVDWLNNTMLLEADMMTEEEVIAHIDNVKNIVEEYYDLVAE